MEPITRKKTPNVIAREGSVATLTIFASDGSVRAHILFDAGDIPLVAAHHWSALGRAPWGPYILRNSDRAYLHRVLMRPKGKSVVDHINGDTLDNRRANLRVVSHRKNCANRHRFKRGEPMWNIKRERGRWTVRLKRNYREIYGGSFLNLADAQRRAAEMRAKLDD